MTAGFGWTIITDALCPLQGMDDPSTADVVSQSPVLKPTRALPRRLEFCRASLSDLADGKCPGVQRAPGRLLYPQLLPRAHTRRRRPLLHDRTNGTEPGAEWI